MKDFEQFMEEVKVDLEESSLNRLASKATKKGVGYMSAERGDKSKKENKERSKQLAKDIRGQGLPGPTKVSGQYIENDGSKDGRKVSERSYAVSSGKKGKRKFKKSMEKLGKKYDQDSVLVQKKPGGQGKLTATNKGGKADLKGWDGKVGKMKPGGSGEIQTGIKKRLLLTKSLLLRTTVTASTTPRSSKRSCLRVLSMVRKFRAKVTTSTAPLRLTVKKPI